MDNGEYLEKHYKKIEEIKKEQKDLKEKEKSTKDKMEIWTRQDVLKSELREENTSVKYLLEWLKNFVEKTEPIIIPYVHELGEKNRSQDVPLKDGFVWRKSAYPCTRCGHQKWYHGWENPEKDRKSCDAGHAGNRCTCPIFTSNKKYPFARQETCPHRDVRIYGTNIKKLRVFCENIYCGKELTSTKRGKELTKDYQRKIPTEKEWKEEKRFHKDDFGVERSELLIIQITKNGNDYKITEGEKICSYCYSNKHSNLQHYKQNYEQMVKSLQESIKRFDKK